MPETLAENHSTLRKQVLQLWPELGWIEDRRLREKVAHCWERALELSPLTPEDLQQIPFTLLVPNCPTTFMEHKRCVVHIARRAAESMKEFMGTALAMESGVPDEVCHIIAAHAGEGDLVKRTTEALIVHHADFMAYLPFKNLEKK